MTRICVLVPPMPPIQEAELIPPTLPAMTTLAAEAEEAEGVASLERTHGTPTAAQADPGAVGKLQVRAPA